MKAVLEKSSCRAPIETLCCSFDQSPVDKDVSAMYAQHPESHGQLFSSNHMGPNGSFGHRSANIKTKRNSTPFHSTSRPRRKAMSILQTATQFEGTGQDEFFDQEEEDDQNVQDDSDGSDFDSEIDEDEDVSARVAHIMEPVHARLSQQGQEVGEEDEEQEEEEEEDDEEDEAEEQAQYQQQQVQQQTLEQEEAYDDGEGDDQDDGDDTGDRYEDQQCEGDQCTIDEFPA
jgi:hypothetical protein